MKGLNQRHEHIVRKRGWVKYGHWQEGWPNVQSVQPVLQKYFVVFNFFFYSIFHQAP